MVFMGRGFTSGGQESGSVFNAVVYKMLSPYHCCLKIEEAASLKMKGSLYSCLLIARFASGSRTLN